MPMSKERILKGYSDLLTRLMEGLLIQISSNMSFMPTNVKVPYYERYLFLGNDVVIR